MKELERYQLEIARLKSEHDRRNELYQAYPALPRLLRILAWIWTDAHPLTNTGDPTGTRIRTQPPQPPAAHPSPAGADTPESVAW